VQVADAEKMESAITEVTAILRSRHNITGDDEEDFNVMSTEAFTEAATSITGIMTIFLGGIAGISLLVGGIGIMNIMLVSVIERTKEIGLRKAVGARDSDILLQFMVESLIIGLAGGILGILVGWGISSLIKGVATFGSTTLNPEISVASILMSVGFSVAVGLIFGIFLPVSFRLNVLALDVLILNVIFSGRFEAAILISFLLSILATAIGAWIGGRNLKPREVENLRKKS